MAKGKAAAAPITWFNNAVRSCIVVKRGTGPGSTKSLAYGGKSPKFANFAAARKEAERLVRDGW